MHAAACVQTHLFFELAQQGHALLLNVSQHSGVVLHKQLINAAKLCEIVLNFLRHRR